MLLRPYQIEAVDHTFDAWAKSPAVLGVASTGLGKAQPLDAKVLTPTGFVPMGSLRVGHLVCTPRGRVARVSGVYPQGIKPVYRVTLNDGANTECCREHLWAVRTKSAKHLGRGYLLKTTAELVGDLHDGNGNNKWFIPVTSPVVLAATSLPIDPYVVGVLIGDGGLKHRVMLSSADEFIIEEVNRRLLLETSITHVSGCDYILRGNRHPGRTGSLLRNLLTEVGLFGKGAKDKFIPYIYQHATIDDRIALLRGLMDTDGTVRLDGHAEFNTVSSRLAFDVRDLVRGLGGVTKVRDKAPGWYTHRGERRLGQPSFRITITLNGINPFLLPRKAERANTNKIQGQTRAIRSIKPSRQAECQCIAIDDPDGLYLTDNHIVTHNTIIFASIIARQPGRAMVLAHREELIFQAADKIRRVTGLESDIEMAELRAAEIGLHGKAQAVISTIQTQVSGKNGGRMQRFNPHEFSLLVVDECHHAPAGTYRRVIDHYRRNPNLRVLGVTATPDRTDEEALGKIFDEVAFDYDIRFGINDGWLVPIIQRSVDVDGLDLSAVRTTAGDLNGADLARVMEFEGNLHEIASPTLDLTKDGRKTLIFAASLAHAERLCEILNRHKPGCARWVHGGTPKPDRRKLFADYAKREFQYLVNVGVATEGFDDPGIEAVVMARPTESRSLYAQMIGRGLRPLPGVADDPDHFGSPLMRRDAIAGSGKPSVEIIDFVGNCGKHRLISTADILGGKYSDDIVERARSKARNGARNMMEALSEAEQEIRAERERAKQAETARRAKLVAGVKYRTTMVDPFDVFGLTPWRERGWDKDRPLTPKMVDLLERQGVETRGLSFTQAKQLIAEITSRWDADKCSYKQAKILAARGLPSNVSRQKASEMITAIAGREGWKSRRKEPQVTGQGVADRY